MGELKLLQINEVRLAGRLTKDPELKETKKGQAVCRIDLAVNRSYKDANGEWKEESCFIPVIVWQEKAVACRDFLKKGSAIYVEGRLKQYSWETSEGAKRYRLEVDSRKVQFLNKKEPLEYSVQPPPL